MVTTELSHSHFSSIMAKPIPRNKSSSIFLSDGFLFLGGAFSALLLVWGFSSFTNPIPNDNLTLKPHKNNVVSYSTSDLRFDPPDQTFYDDPEMEYTMTTKIDDWDEKREEWLKHHPSFSAGAKERVLMVTGSQPSPCKNPIGDHLLLRFFKNKVDYSRIHGYDIFYNNALLHPKMFAYWAKYPVVKAAMMAHPEAEWIWWVDSDALFTDMDFKLPLKRYKDHNLVVHGWPHLIHEKRSWTGLNAGVFLIRNCQWSLDFMEAWAGMGPQSPDYEEWGKTLRSTFKDKFFPESDDQTGLAYLIAIDRTVTVNGINIHIAEKGQGPLILFIHGFPDLWYSWRHQITYLACHGYRCVAPDLRGYGDTDIPASPTSYTSLHIVGDIIGLLDAIAGDQEKVFVVGHDWGALTAWYLSLYRPERIKALVNLSVAFTPRNPKRKPLDTLRAVYGNDYYISRFQEPGDIEAEFAEIGTERVLKEFLTYRNPGPLYLPKGKGFGHPNDSPIVLPPWLLQQECNYYASKFDKTGFTGALNYYRNIDLNWELNAPWTGAQVKVPVKFIVGDLDLTYNAPGARDYIHKGGMKRDVPLLEDVVVIEGAGHFIHQERADKINKYIYDFFKKF